MLPNGDMVFTGEGSLDTGLHCRVRGEAMTPKQPAPKTPSRKPTKKDDKRALARKMADVSISLSDQ